MTKLNPFFQIKNDRCSFATDLGLLSYGQSVTVSGQSNNGARDEDDDEFWISCRPEIHKGVWYKFSVEFSAEVKVSTCNEANFDTLVAVYENPCGALLCQNLNYNAIGCNGTSLYSYGEYSQSIYILVGGSSETTGSFDLTVTVIAILVSTW